MSGKGLMGFVVVGLMVLGTVWLYNKFSGKNIGDLGKSA